MSMQQMGRAAGVIEATGRNGSSPPATHLGGHAAYQTHNARQRLWPFEHLSVDELFPPEQYDELHSRLPSDAAYTSSPNGRYPERGRVMLLGADGDELDQLAGDAAEFWRGVSASLFDRVFLEALAQRFCPGLAQRVLKECWVHAFLCRDRGGYAISPHTDTSRKLITGVIYLSEPGSACDPANGTCLCVPDDPSRYSFDTPHTGSWEGTSVVSTVPYRANAMLAFLVSDRSLHGVRPTPAGMPRDTLQFSLMRPEGSA